MPHFIIDCSKNVLNLKSPEEILREVHEVAESTRLFKEGDIKVRIRPYEYFTVGNTGTDFVPYFR